MVTKFGTMLLVVAFSAVGLAGCGSGSDSNTPGTEAGKTGKIDCAADWPAHVKANPQGREQEFRTVIKVNGRVFRDSRDTERVVESNAERVVISTNGAAPVPKTRQQFLDSCGKGGLAGPSPEGTMEIVERSRKTVTVPAGTFDCAYIKMRVTSNAEGTTSTGTVENWSEGDERSGAIVKSITTMESMVTTRELVRRG